MPRLVNQVVENQNQTPDAWNLLAGKLIMFISLADTSDSAIKVVGSIARGKNIGQMIAGSALGVVGNIVRWGTLNQIQSLIKDHRLMICLRSLLRSEFKKFRKEACQIISNIAVQSETLMKDIIEEELMELLCHMLEKDEPDMKTMEDHKSEIENWDLGAGIYISFYQFMSILQEDNGNMNKLDAPERKNEDCENFLSCLNDSLTKFGSKLPLNARVAYTKIAEEVCDLLLVDSREGATRGSQLSRFNTVLSAPIPENLKSNHLQDAVSFFTSCLSEDQDQVKLHEQDQGKLQKQEQVKLQEQEQVKVQSRSRLTQLKSSRSERHME